MERETGLEPATTCLEGRNSTTELLPLCLLIIAYIASWSLVMKTVYKSYLRANLHLNKVSLIVKLIKSQRREFL